ncbi:MAG: glycosyltransferase family 1 protein [Dorea sp.]|nr:glycosyltransferase family 1 protein [Dorea sp.]
MSVRVLHVVTYMGRGGLETMLMNYYRQIDRNKVQFDFLVHRDFEADYDQEIRELGGKIYHISRLVPWSRLYREELRRFFRGHSEYKIVHVHQDCLSSVALQCAKECGVPIRIAHCHSSSAVKNLKYPIKLHYMKQIPRYATHLFACGKQAGDWMFSGCNYKIVRNAIDTEKYLYSPVVAEQVRNELGLNDSIVIGHVGNFTPAKNHSFLLEIFQEILKKESKAQLLLVGGGDGLPSIREKVNNLGIQDHVIFTGVRSDVSRLMQAMNVFVFPSLYEGLPVTMIEAQASGMHCVISDHVSEECIVTNGLVSRKRLDDSPVQWSESVLQLCYRSRKNHIDEIKKAGYDIPIAAKKIEKFYLQNAEE